MKTTYKIISSIEELDFLINCCFDTRMVAVDFETTGHERSDPNFRPTILGISFQPGSAWVLPLAHKESPWKDTWEKPFKKFCEAVITNPSICKVGWNVNFEYSIFYKYGYTMRGRVFDAMLSKYLLDETRPNDLKSMVDRLLPEFSGYELPGTPSSKASRAVIINFWSNVKLEPLSKYCAGDADFTYRISLHLENKLIKHDLYHLFRNLYMPIVRILGTCYLRGVKIDRAWITYLDSKYQNLSSVLEKDLRSLPEVEDFQDFIIQERIDRYIDTLQEEIDGGGLSDRQINSRYDKISRVEAWDPGNNDERKLFEPINFASSKQMSDLLYTSKGFGFKVLQYTDSGLPSTGEDTLKKLLIKDDSGFIEKLLELRGLQKLHSTYISNVLLESLTQEDKIYPSYLPHATVTGRFSSKNPNMQNIPRVTTNPDIKKYIIPPKDFYFVELDGSQMELRVAAEMFKDKAMIEIFKENKNIHVATAARIYGVEYDLLNKARKNSDHPNHDEMVRKHKVGKVLNFTIFYGATSRKVSEFVSERTGVNVGLDEAQDLIDAWFEAFPQAAKGIQKMQALAKSKGFVTSPIGRKRRLPILQVRGARDNARGEYNEALRQAVNAPIQGFASDLTQEANINLYMAQLKGIFPRYFKLISTVHDSLEFPVHKSDIHQVIPKAMEIAGNTSSLGRYLGYDFKHVQLKFSAELGITWGHTEEYDPNINYEEKYTLDVLKWNTERASLGLSNF